MKPLSHVDFVFNFDTMDKQFSQSVNTLAAFVTTVLFDKIIIVLRFFGREQRGFVFSRRLQSLTFSVNITGLSYRSVSLIARLKICLFIAVDLALCTCKIDTSFALRVCLSFFPFLFHLHHILLPLPAEVSLMISTAPPLSRDSWSLRRCLTK